MLDLPGAVDRPARDSVAVLVQHRRDWRDRLQLTATGDKFCAGRLNVAGLVPCTALQSRDVTVPAPRHAKGGESLAQYRLLQRRLSPASPAIGRNLHRGDPSCTGIGDAGYLVNSGLFQGQ